MIKPSKYYWILPAVLVFSIGANGANQSHPQTKATKPLKQQEKKGKVKSMAEIYQFKAKSLDGKDIDLKKYEGDVMLIVNTASKCGYTPQYTGLEELHKKFNGRGLKVLGFPCNQFGQQEPGNADAIGEFCQKNYGVDFQMFEKIDVNGPDAHPLYKYLTKSGGSEEPIKWNFTKFLVDRKGAVIKRYPPDVKPEDMTADVEKQL